MHFQPKDNVCLMNGLDSIKNMLIRNDASRFIFFVFPDARAMTGERCGLKSSF